MQHNGSDPGRTAALAVPALALPPRVDAPPAPAEALPEPDLNEPDGLQAVGDHDPRQIPARSQLGRPHRPADEPTDVRHGTEHQPDAADDDANRSAVAAMRRFWDAEIAQGRIPTGAALSRAAGVPPTTGLGRRRRREWEAELSDHLRRTVAGASR